MRVPIPNDWDGTSWRCVEILWPDSDLWLGILTGLLITPMKGRFWDERTGVITDAQDIGRQIYDACFPLMACSGDVPDESGSGDGADVAQIVGAACAAFEDFLMTNCSVPYGTIRWNGGVLQYRYCGEWYDVEGTPGYSPTLPQPGDDEAPEIDPEVWTEPTPCSKAVAITDLLFGIVDELLDSAETPETPAGAVSNVRNRFPQINFGDANLLNAYLHAAQVRTLGYSSEVEDSTFQQKILCNVSLQISAGNQGLTEDERAAVQSAISSVCRQDFTVVTHPTVFASVELMYVLAYRAIGATDTVNVTSYATPAGDENCDCPAATPPYDGGLTFTGAFDAPQNPDWVNSVEVGDNGRYVDISWTTPPGYSKNEDSFKLFMHVVGSISDFVLKVSALNGNVPLNSQTTSEYCGDPAYWTQPGIIWTPVDVDTWTTVGQVRYNYTHFTDPAVADVTLDSYFCDCPSNETGDYKTYNFRFELVEVNGEPYG